MYNPFSIETAFLSENVGGNPFKITEFGPFVTNILSLIMIIAAIASLLYLFWGGLEWIISGGDKAGTDRAKSKITDAVIGLVIVFSAWAIFQLLQTFLGFQITEKLTSTSSSSGGTSSVSQCNAAKDSWVSQKSGCKINPTDWGCWKTFIEGKPCLNFNDGTGSYWPHSGCGNYIPPNICPK